MGDSMGSQPQKTQGSPNFFLFIGFVELFMLIIFIKKILRSLDDFTSYSQNTAKIARTREIQSFSILALAPSRIEQIEIFFYKNDQHEKLNKIDYVKKC